jgi:hypothetical protein
MKATPLINDFTSGEWSPLLEGRSDLEQYSRSAGAIENLLVLPYGGVTKIPGTHFVAEVKDNTKKVRLIPFEFNVLQAYMLEFGNQYIRFYMNHEQIVHTLDSVGVWDNGIEYVPWDYVKNNSNIYRCILTHTDQEPPNTTYWIATNIYEIESSYLEEDLPEIKFVQSADVMFLVHSKYVPKKLSRLEHSSWTLEDYVPYGVPFDLRLLLYFNGENGATVFPEAARGHGFTAVGTAQVSTANKKWGTGSLLLDGNSDGIISPDSGDWDVVRSNTENRTIHLWVKHVDHAGEEYYIEHHQGTSYNWHLRHLHGSGLQFRVRSVGAIILSTSFGGEITDTDWHHVALVKVGSKYGVYLDGQQVGYTEDSSTALFSGNLVVGYYGAGGNWLNGNIDEIQIWNSNIFKGSPKPDNSDTITVPTEEQVVNPFASENNYPACVALFEQRLILAATNNKPHSFWASKSGDYEEMSLGVNDGDALMYTLASNQTNVIRWIFGDILLFAGTSGGVFNISSGDVAYPLTPTNIAVRKHTNFGCNTIMPVKMGNFLCYIQRNNLTLREYSYEYTKDSFLSLDITLLAEHILKTGVVDIAYQQSPYNLLYCIKSDGEIAVFTRNLIQQVMGWTRLPDLGKAESVGVISRATGGDEVWFVFNRTVGGETKRFIEYLDQFSFESLADAFFVRSGLSYSGGPVSTMEGLDHLIGEEVTILGDGAVFPKKTVNEEGKVSLSTACSKIHAGLSYPVKLRLQKLESGSVLGTAQGKIQRISQLAIKFYRSLGCFFGTEDKKDVLPFRSTGMDMDAPPDLFTGTKKVVFPKGYGKDIKVEIYQDQPLPLTILSIVPFSETHES